jgi:oxygen-independent coproporphyrinogen-3 oxidase
MTYQELLSRNDSPIQDSESLSEENQRTEFLMLTIRMREGIGLNLLDEYQRLKASDFERTGHIDSEHWRAGKLVLTQTGRLIADRIVREMMV